MFADTITFTINSVAKVLNRINQDSYGSEYLLKENDSEFRARLRNTSYTNKTTGVKVDRHNVELTETIYGATPSDPPVIRKSYLVFENETGDGIDANNDFVDGFVGFVTSANVLKLLNWEN